MRVSASLILMEQRQNEGSEMYSAVVWMRALTFEGAYLALEQRMDSNFNKAISAVLY